MRFEGVYVCNYTGMATGVGVGGTDQKTKKKWKQIKQKQTWSGEQGRKSWEVERGGKRGIEDG